MKLLVITLVVSSLLIPAKHLDKTKKNNSQRFLDKVQTIDPNAKFEIDLLKEEFQAQKDQIDVKYEQKTNTLKKQRKQERGKDRASGMGCAHSTAVLETI